MHSLMFGVYLWLTFVYLALELPLANSSVTSNNITAKEHLTDEDLATVCEDASVLPSSLRNSCCPFVHREFRNHWYYGGYYLTDYLTTLQTWGCAEFLKECKNPVYDYNKFTQLVYDRFCNRNTLLAKCAETLHNITKRYGFLAYGATYGSNKALKISSDIWTNLTSSLRPAEMTINDLTEPCIQIALFDRPSGGVGRFHEISQPFLSFCDISWAGYDVDTAMERGVSPWTSSSIRCRSSIIVGMVVVGVLGSGVIMANAIVLSVYLTKRKLRNSQAIFKISIATGDLLSGLIVFPNIIVFQYLMFMHPRTMGEELGNSTDLVRRHPGGGFFSIISREYVNFVGFFTTLSLTVSMYTLLAASFDRFSAIFRPLKYIKARAKLYAKITCGAIWFAAILFACIPFMAYALRYRLILGILVTSVGPEAVIMLAIAFGLPLITLCVVNMLTFNSARKHARVRQRLQSSSKMETKEDSMEMRLRKILGLMVGVFTICLFPVFFLLILANFFDNLLFYMPEKLDYNAAMIYNSVEYCAILLFLSNSLWNCFIYSSRGEDFRTAVKSLRFFKVAGAAANFVSRSARRLSEVPVYYRRKSSSGSGATEAGTRSSHTTRLPSVESSNVFANETTSPTGSSAQRSRSSFDSTAPKVYYSTVQKDKLKKSDNNEYVTDDSTFGSFAIDAGADRLFMSVMDNIDEGKEEEC